MQMIRVAVLDAHVLTRNGLGAILTGAGVPAAAVGLFADVATLKAHLDTVRVNIIMLADVPSEGREVARLVAELHQTYPAVGLVVVSSRLQTDYIRRLFSSGARGFIYRKGQLEETVPAALQVLSRGEVYLSPEAAALPYVQQPVPATLDDRDLAVLYLLAQGYRVKEIGRQMAIDRKVVYNSRDKLRRVLQVSNNEQIVPAAMMAGLLPQKLLQP
jgi:DNA-binding NarL/FixJ family response regulator